MTDPKSSGYYKATINGDSLFLYFDTRTGWNNTWYPVTEWFCIHYEVCSFNPIQFVKY
jgi:hypothetical protein